MKTIYLAGPMTGHTWASCSGWRYLVGRGLSGVRLLTPLRGKKGFDSEGPLMTPKGIIGRDYFDVERADVILVDLRTHDKGSVSVGTMFELAWAYQTHKPVIAMTSGPLEHPFLIEAVTFTVETVEDAIDLIQDIL